MTHEEILTKAIEIAKKQGYSEDHYYCNEFDMYESSSQFCESVIFSHSFAKAFWGNNKPFVEYGPLIQTDSGLHTRCFHKPKPAWQTHLQLMVLEEDPIRYLEKFL